MNQKKDYVYIQHIVESIMESSQHISEATKTANPHIPWRTMAGFRNVLTHDYLALDLQIVWNVVEHELPSIKPMFQALLEHEDGEK